MSFLSDAYIDDAVSGNDSTRKRRRDDDSISRDIDRRPFTIHTNPTDPFSQPRTLTPICLLSRAQLPLAFLDTAQDGSRLFAAVIQPLETCHDYQDDTNVLIVLDERANRFYAVERVQTRRYALCRLGIWVKEQELMTRATLDVRPVDVPRKRRAVQVGEGNQPWWTSASVDTKGRRDSEAWLTAGHLKLSMTSTAGGAPAALSLHLPTTMGGPKDSLHDSEPLDMTSSEIVPSLDALEELTKQYLETVYLSRTPLAYFVKGPLARARLAYSTQPSELISFLRGAILSSSVMDKKYRDVITDQVKELAMFEPEVSAVKPKVRKKRKWKVKRDKFGCFVDEKDHVEQWWRMEDDSGGMPSSTDSVDVVLRRRVPKLRIRETFLQIILILETLALETTVPACEVQESQIQAVESQPTTEGKKAKKKKEIDISNILETLIDRLCIWHSLEASSPVKNATNSSSGPSNEANDDLRTFASEVIMPFYASRIPEQASVTSKKLGGPTLLPPAKKSSAAPRKPGEPAARQVPEKVPRRPLGRVSTDTLNRTDKRQPILHRSATDSDALMPLIKREQSDAPAVLENVPAVNPRAFPVKRGASKRVSLLDQISANRREVDLSAVSKANELKMRRNAEIRERVRDAILTTRKPNRTLASEDLAKSTDESFAKALAKGKSGSNVRKVIEKRRIDATPRVKATPAPKTRTQKRSEESTSMASSASARLFARPMDVPDSSIAVPQTGHRPRHTSNIEDTPSRGFAHYMPKGLARLPGTLLESPTASRMAPISETPSRPLSVPGLEGASIVKSFSKGTGFAGRLEASQLLGAASSQSQEEAFEHATVNGNNLYAGLGWDSDEYEELD